MAFLLAFSASVFSIRWHADLLPTSTLILLIAVASLLILLSRHRYTAKNSAVHCSCLILAGLSLGVSYSHFYAANTLAHRLPSVFWNQDVEAIIDVVSLPQDKSHVRQFEAKILSLQHPQLQHLRGQKLLLKRYSQIDADIHSCERWSVQLRLKPVYGLRNNAGFDYQGFLFQQGIQIKGYLRSATKVSAATDFCINAWREQWRSYLIDHFYPHSAEMLAWLSALSIGDKSLLNAQQRQTLQLSGSFHLFVISGLHIGLVAAGVYALALLIRRLGGGRLYSGDWRPLAAVFSLLAAGFYGLMAGWQLPVQRALLTLLIFMSTSLLGLQWSLWHRFVLALFLVLLLQPMASLNPGFILSFAAVFFLLLLQQYKWLQTSAFTGVKESSSESLPGFIVRIKPWCLQWRRQFIQLLVLQLGLCIALMPFLLVFFQQWSWIMIVVNLIFIPLMGLIIIPLLLIAMLYWLLMNSIAVQSFIVSDKILDFLSLCFDVMMPMLQAFIHLTGAEQQYNSGFDSIRLLALLLAVLFLLGPNILLNRFMALMLFVAVGLSFCSLNNKDAAYLPDDVALQLDVLDVGQGLSVLIQTPFHRLLYDTGASWKSSSMVQWVHKPLFKARGILQLDKVIISHTDNDHSGGLQDLLKQFVVTQVYADAELAAASTLIQSGGETGFSRCNSSLNWRWQQADFQILHPEKDFQHRDSNNLSCVLQITVAGRRILLTGDIEVSVEALLMRQGLEQMDILVVPHHGSRTSSSLDFLQVIKPKYALLSAGFLNRYGHPHNDVVMRYKAQNIPLINTAEQGRIRLQVFNDGSMQWYYAAEHSLFYHYSDTAHTPLK